MTEQTGEPEEDYAKLITFVPDRLGHDRRYALRVSPLVQDSCRRRAQDLEVLLAATVSWECGDTGETAI